MPTTRWRFAQGAPGLDTVAEESTASSSPVRATDCPRRRSGSRARSRNSPSVPGRSGAGGGRPDVVVAVSPALLATAAVAARARAQGVPAGVIVQDLYTAGAEELQAGRGVRLLGALELGDAPQGGRRQRDPPPVPRQVASHRRSATRPRHRHPQLDSPRRDAARPGRRSCAAGLGRRFTVVLHAGAMGEKQGPRTSSRWPGSPTTAGWTWSSCSSATVVSARRWRRPGGACRRCRSVRRPLPDDEFVDALAGADRSSCTSVPASVRSASPRS